MRKVELNMDENNKYEIIKKLVESDGNKNTACTKLGCSRRHLNRMIHGYKEYGKAYFVHGNKGRAPAISIALETKNMVIDMYNNKYFDANFTHYTELLAEHEKIEISVSTVKNILMDENILSPKANRVTKKNMKAKLKALQDKPGISHEEKTKITQSIISIEDAHPRRPRCAYFGEMIQMDASLHNWFGNDKSQLHIAIDDSTGTIVAAYFDLQETLKGYYNLFNQILNEYGIPYMFFTDRRTVFEYKNLKAPRLEDDTFTQFGYACKQFGVEIKTSSVPQAKGRVERVFGTLQSRLVVELRLAGVTTIGEANEFLNSYIKKFNAKFSLPINNNKSVFETQPTDTSINLTLAVIVNRKIDSGHCIHMDKKCFKTYDTNGNPIYHRKGTEALVIKAFDGELYASINDIIYALNEVPISETVSKNFDVIETVTKQNKQYIPPMSHPWKRASFASYLKKQSHQKEKLETIT